MTSNPNPNPGPGIDMAELLGNAARAHGLDPSHADPIMGPVIAHLFRQVGPVIVDPDRTGHQLRWLAAGLDAMARAAELATATAEDETWAYQIDPENAAVQLHGELLTADGGAINCTLATTQANARRLLAVLDHIRGSDAYRAWARTIPHPPTLWNLQVHDGTVYLHTAVADYTEMPEPDQWEPRPHAWVHLGDIAHLHDLMTSHLAGTR